jgi:hypothetical protein
MEAADARGMPGDEAPESPPAAVPEADQPVGARCAAHPQVETYLRCGRCETPICPRCLVMTPVGARCRDCARLRRLPMFDVKPIHYLRGLAAGIAVAAVGAVVLASIPRLGFFGLLLLAGLGYLVGEAATAAANRKRGTGLALAAAAAVPLGMALGRAVLLLVAGGGRVDAASALAAGATSLLAPLWSVLLLLVAMAIAYSRVR